MILSKMLLEDFWLTSLSIKLKETPPETFNNTDIPHLNTDFDVKKIVDEWKFFVSLMINMTWSDESDCAFEEVNLSITGLFSFREDLDENEVLDYIPVLALSNLFGLLRGFLSQFTANFPGGSCSLPLVNLNDLISKKQNQLD